LVNTVRGAGEILMRNQELRTSCVSTRLAPKMVPIGRLRFARRCRCLRREDASQEWRHGDTRSYLSGWRFRDYPNFFTIFVNSCLVNALTVFVLTLPSMPSVSSSFMPTSSLGTSEIAI
jgi:hypothetical protein